MKSRLILLISFSLLLLGLTYPAAAQLDARVYSTAQRFENGLMLWRSDTGFIWVLANNGRAFTYPATSYSNLPDNPIFGDPPSRLRPIFGFGKVWGNNTTIRQLIGWPTLPEMAFDMGIRQVGGTTYLTQFDGTVYQINPDRTWSFAVTPPPSEPYVLNLMASPNPVVPGGTVTINWTVQGTELVIIHMFDTRPNPDGTQNLLESRDSLPLTGAATFTVPASATAGVKFTVWGVNRAHFASSMSMWQWVVQSSLVVSTTANPAGRVTTQAAFQQYENGFMIWRADLGTVYAFYGSGGGPFGGFPQSSYEFLPDNPFFEVPAGRVWGNNESARRTLGWATGGEQGYQLTIQSTSSGSDFTLPDGRIVHQQRGWWSF